VATQDPVRQRALVVTDKAERVYYFHANTLHALAELVGAAGLARAADITPDHLMQRTADGQVRPLSDTLDTIEPGCLLESAQRLDALPWPFCSGWRDARADSW